MATIVKNGYKGKYDLILPDKKILAQYKDAKQKRVYNLRLTVSIIDKLKIAQELIRKEFGNITIYATSSVVDGAYIDELTETEEPIFWNLKKSKKTWQGLFVDNFKISDIDLYNHDNKAIFWKIKEGETLEKGSEEYDWKLHMYGYKGEHGIEIKQFIKLLEHGNYKAP